MKKKIGSVLARLLCALAVMAAAVLVRTGPAAFKGIDSKTIDAFRDDESGVPYLTDMDSYYHVRLLDNYLKNGRLGDGMKRIGAAAGGDFAEASAADGASGNGKDAEGQEWDTKSFYPEGRSAKYQPGIIWLAAAAQRLSGAAGKDAQEIPYKLSAYFSAFSGLAACLAGRRIGGLAGGLSAGLLVACAPVYVSRTCYGRFDTDMFVVLMELLLIFFVTETLRASSRRSRILSAAGFALAAGAYSLCWTPTYGMLFAGLTLAGGVLACFFLPLAQPAGSAAAGSDAEKTRGTACCARCLKRVFTQPGFIALAAAGFLTAILLFISSGAAVFSRIFAALFFTSASARKDGVLPNLLESVAELGRSGLFPQNLLLAWKGYVPGAMPCAVNGVGGATVFFLSLASLAWLFLSCFPRRQKKRADLPGRRENSLSRADCLVYFCVLGTWLAAGIYLAGKGVRFIEHLSIPTGLLAGGLIGHLFERASADPDKKHRLPGQAGACLLLLGAALPALTGAWACASESRPTVSDASAKAMQYIRASAEDEDAVIASWWDMGYYYESASGHPCLWDGGTQNGTRAIMISKALTADSLELSRRILLMLSHSGNGAADFLMEHTDPRTAFGTLFEAIVLEKEEGIRLLCDRCGLSDEQAERVWAMMRPDLPKETFLILTYTMSRQIGWYEHYADWDFTGTQPLPASTLYAYTPEGTPVFRTLEGQEYLQGVRARETLWRLFFNAEQTPCFTPAFEWHDGLEHVRVWRVEG